MYSNFVRIMNIPFSFKILSFYVLALGELADFGTKRLLCPGVLVVCVLKPLSILSFATNCPNVFVSVCELAFFKFLERKEIFNFFFSGSNRRTLW